MKRHTDKHAYMRGMGGVKTLLVMLLMLVAGVGKAEAQTPVLSEDGYYLIQNENNDKMYYLIPSPHQLYQDNAATPYLRTAMTAREASVWKIQRDDDNTTECYNIIHALDGKYVTKRTDGTEPIVYLKTIADVSSLTTTERNLIRYRFIKSTNNNYGIVPYGLNEGTDQNTSFNPFSSNDNTGKGYIGLWRSDNDASSRWIFIKTTAPLTVAYNAGDNNFTIACEDASTTIYYTTDGSDPRTSDSRQLYSTAIPATDVSIVRATGEKAGCTSVVYEAINPYKQFYIEHLLAPGFYMLTHSNGTSINTSSLPRQSMAATLEPAANIDGAQYYYVSFMIDGVKKYIHSLSTGTTVSLKTEDEFITTDNGFKLRFDFDAVHNCYHIVSMASPSRAFWKDDDNNGSKLAATSDTHANRIDKKTHWNLVPADVIADQPIPFAPSTEVSTTYYKIANANTSTATYYILPPTGTTGNDIYANTTSEDGDNIKWYFKKAGEDAYLTYYYIINAVTGEYLYYGMF